METEQIIFNNKEFNLNKFKEVIKKTNSIRNFLNTIKVLRNKKTYTELKYLIKLYDLSISHWRTCNVFILDDHLKDFSATNKPSIGSNRLKLNLFKYNYFNKYCYLCKAKTWNDLPIPLELHHINGNNKDNRIENLTILCPNCHAQTSTYRGKNIKKSKDNIKQEIIKPIDFKRIKKQSKEKTLQRKYGNIEDYNKIRQENYIPKGKRKVERPSYEQLLKDIEETNYLQTGKKYGVSDNCIRKWIKYYEKENKLSPKASDK
jgi:hypothetical protein